VPAYPNAENVQLATPIPPATSLGTPTGIDSPGLILWTTRITRFTTGDSADTVITFYKDNLTRVGWLGEDDTTPDRITFGWSIESTVWSASRTNPCAPTVETSLPGYGVVVSIVSKGDILTSVEVQEFVSVGY
jgi:hypothetical protein